MGIEEHQGEALSVLDAAYARACVVVAPDLLALAQARIDWLVADGPVPPDVVTERDTDVVAVLDQMLIDVAGLDDDTVLRAARHFDDGVLADLVTASYVMEARTRLRICASRLIPDAA